MVSFKYLNILLILIMFIGTVAWQNAEAELFNSRNKNEREAQPSLSSDKEKIPPVKSEALPNDVAGHVANVTSYCVGKWESEACLKELSSVSMDMAVNFAENLDAKKEHGAIELIKQHCSAPTAALKISVPAYAMKSAITECVNSVADINEATSVKPDLNLYQLLVGSVLCLDKDPACADIEKQLSSTK